MIFKINESLAVRAVDGLTDEQLWYRPSAGSNPALWLFGHLVFSRAQLLGALGEPVETGWGTLFSRGATVEGPAGYPSRDAIATVLAEVSPRLYTKLGSLTAEDLAKPGTGPVPLIQTLGDRVTFLTMHDSYHVGQLAYLRKQLGLPGLVG